MYLNDSPKKESPLSESASDEDIACTVYSSFDEIGDMQQEWDSFVESVSGDIYLTFDWCRIWWRYYGAGRKLRLFVFRKGDVIVGIVPFFIENVGWKPIELQIAKIVGSDFTMVILIPPYRRKYSRKIVSYVNEQLFCSDRCDAICWGPLSSIHPATQAIESEVENCKEPYKIIKKTSLGNYTLFPLSKDLDSYLESLDKKVRQNIRRRVKKLKDSYQVELKIENTLQNFYEFAEIHEKQWGSVNKLGHFGDWPHAKAFHADLVQSHSQLGRLRLFCLYANDKPVAYRYVYCFGKRYYSFLPARICDAEWDKLGLGQIMHIMTAEKAIEEAVCEIDAGRGHYDHKLRLGGHEYKVFSLLISNNRFSSIFRAHLFCFFSKILHLVYYKIWFNRLAPMLPFKRKPLWECWIRTRL